MIQSLGDFKTYNQTMQVGEEVWKIVSVWDSFLKDTLGRQLVRSADSIAANLSEGLGRYHIKETRNFSFYSRGSLFETKTWLAKAYNRKLITKELFKKLTNDLEVIGKMLNGYIKTLDRNNIVNESDEIYGDL
ncbi:MAG: four helix bundle protein [Cyclobacteriaceae bacterium]